MTAVYIALGSPSVTSLFLNRSAMTLTCTSTGGPPTTVTWRKNGVLVNDTLFHQSQRVVDTNTATYENLLISHDIANLIGNFSCLVSNDRGTREQTVELNGMLAT